MSAANIVGISKDAILEASRQVYRIVDSIPMDKRDSALGVAALNVLSNAIVARPINLVGCHIGVEGKRKAKR